MTSYDWDRANPDDMPEEGDDPPCGICGRDNRNGTHDALETAGHLSHAFISWGEVNDMSVVERWELREACLRRGVAISDNSLLNAASLASKAAEERRQKLLTFAEFSRINEERCARWHPGFPMDDSWTLADWSNALAGETGELANVIKKIRRIDTAHFSNRHDEQDRAVLVAKALGEAGDVLAYLDLLVTKLGGDLGHAGAEKFNAISEREGYPERMPSQ